MVDPAHSRVGVAPSLEQKNRPFVDTGSCYLRFLVLCPMVHVIDNRPSRIGFAGRRRRRPPRKDGFVYFEASNGKKIYDGEISTSGMAADPIATSTSMNGSEPSNMPLPDSFAVTLSPCDDVKVSLTDASVQTVDVDFETSSALAPSKVSAQTELIEEQQRLIESLLDQLLKKDIEIDQLREQILPLPSQNAPQQEEAEELSKSYMKQIDLLEEEFKNFRVYHVQKLQEAMCEVERWKKEALDYSSQLETHRKQVTSNCNDSKGHPPATVTPLESSEVGIPSSAIKKRTVYNGRFLFENPSLDMVDTSAYPTPVTHSRKLPMPTPDDRALRAVLEVSSKKRKKRRIDQESSTYSASRVIRNRVLTFAGEPLPKLTRRHGNPQVPRCTIVIHSPIPCGDED